MQCYIPSSLQWRCLYSIYTASTILMLMVALTSPSDQNTNLELYFWELTMTMLKNFLIFSLQVTFAAHKSYLDSMYQEYRNANERIRRENEGVSAITGVQNSPSHDTENHDLQQGNSISMSIFTRIIKRVLSSPEVGNLVAFGFLTALWMLIFRTKSHPTNRRKPARWTNSRIRYRRRFQYLRRCSWKTSEWRGNLPTEGGEQISRTTSRWEGRKRKSSRSWRSRKCSRFFTREGRSSSRKGCWGWQSRGREKWWRDKGWWSVSWKWNCRSWRIGFGQW